MHDYAAAHRLCGGARLNVMFRLIQFHQWEGQRSDLSLHRKKSKGGIDQLTNEGALFFLLRSLLRGNVEEKFLFD
jgi:hypothetical protein